MTCQLYDSCGRGCGRVPTPIGLLCDGCASDLSADGERGN